MRDKFIFSDGDDLTTLNSTGIISTNIWDFEEDAIADGMIMGWLNVHINSTDNTGAAEGIDIQFRASDNVNGSSPEYLGCIKLLQAEIAAGGAFCVGVCRYLTLRYLSVWYKADTNAMNGNTLVDAWFSQHPISVTAAGIQKKPA